MGQAHIMTYDRFASYYNRKCDKFNSKFWCTCTSGINAFNFDWSSENNWLFPPPNLICDTIKKVLKENAKCTLDLIVPEWKSAPHWPMIFSERYLKPSIMAKEIFTGLNFTHRGRGQNGIFGKKEQAFRFIALRILFSRGFSFFQESVWKNT
jgi:hypothetical protein